MSIPNRRIPVVSEIKLKELVNLLCEELYPEEIEETIKTLLDENALWESKINICTYLIKGFLSEARKRNLDEDERNELLDITEMAQELEGIL